MIDFFFDFETRSRLSIDKVGAVKYATDKSTEATLLTWCFSRTGTVKAWRIGQPIPNDLRDVMENPDKYHFVAANVEFDYMIWISAFAKQMMWEGITIKRPGAKNISDLFALTRQFRIGSSLEKAAQMLGLPQTKDKEGRKLMLKQCKPDRYGKFVELTPEEWVKFEKYGIIDTVLLRQVYYKTPQLPAAERWLWEWTFTRNLKGIKIDKPLLAEMKKIVDHYLPQYEKEFFKITSLKVKSPKCKDWFLPHFPWIKNMQADTVRDMMLEKDSKPPHVRRALEIKALAGSTSVSKIKCASTMEHQGRIYDTLNYHIAQTKRFGGKGVQIHNFPRPSSCPDELPKDLNIVDLASIVKSKFATLQDPIGYAKNLLRRIWQPDDGQLLYCGDFSKVEPTVLYWLCGMGAIPKKAYEEMAAQIYSKSPDEISKDSEERQVGKAALLGGGYGMGHKKFKDDTYKKTGIDMELGFAKHVIKTYRRVNKPITDLWRDLQQAFKLAINGQSTRLCNGKIFVMPMQKPWRGVQIRLPSGSYLYYHKAYVKIEEEIQESVEIINGQQVIRKEKRFNENLYYVTDKDGRIMSTKVYGGLLTEHVTSATARDLLSFAMYNLEQANFNVLSTIHDEIWGSSYPGRDQEFMSTMCILPWWATGIELTSDGESGVRYLK